MSSSATSPSSSNRQIFCSRNSNNPTASSSQTANVVPTSPPIFTVLPGYVLEKQANTPSLSADECVSHPNYLFPLRTNHTDAHHIKTSPEEASAAPQTLTPILSNKVKRKLKIMSSSLTPQAHNVEPAACLAVPQTPPPSLDIPSPQDENVEPQSPSTPDIPSLEDEGAYCWANCWLCACFACVYQCCG